jgi:hypothetical protein
MGDTMLGAGLRALHDDGDLAAARHAFDVAYRHAETGGDGAGMGEAALGLGGLWLPNRSGTPESVLVRLRQRRALDRLDETTATGRRLRTRLTAETDHGRGDRTATLGRLAEARKHRDPVELAEAAALARNCVTGPDDHALRADLTGELNEVAMRSGRRSDRLLGLLWHAVDRFLAGSPRIDLTDLQAELAARPHLLIDAAARSIEVTRLMRAGDLGGAEVAAEAAAALGLLAGDPDAAQWLLYRMAAIRWYQGRLGELGPTLREWTRGPSAPAVLALAGYGEAAGIGAAELAALPRTDMWLTRLYVIVEAAHRTGDARLADAAYGLLTPYGNRPMTAGPAVACFGSAWLALGLAALTTGRTGRAVHHLRAAVAANTELGHRPARTLAQWRLSEALARLGDRRGAEIERAAASAGAARMGMSLPPSSHPPVGAARTVGAAARPAGRQPVRCRRVGQLWEFGVGPREVRVPERRGVVYLAMLCTSPGQEIRAAELVAGARLATTAGSAQAVIDDQARRDYRRRLAALHGPSVERDWLRAELAATTGMGGRPRSFRNADERARISVGKAIRRALTQIELADPLVGGRLRDGVRTGVTCSFRE